MEKKVYTIENLDCANCAAKIEAKFNALPQVQEAVIIFPTRQLHLTAEDPDSLLPRLQEIARTVESQVVITSENACHHHHDSHGCCHDHEHNPRHAHRHGAHKEHSELVGILIGAGLFLFGLAVTAFKIPYIGRLLFLGGYLVLGYKVILTAGKNLFKGNMFDEHFLMSLATIGAFAIGEYPEAVGVMLFYRVGEYFEHRATQQSRSQIMEMVDMRPEVVHRIQDGVVTEIPAAQAAVGDLLLVRPGDRIPLDATVISGESRLDTAPITGEPVPLAVYPGQPVISGCINLSGQLTLQVEKVLEESMVSRILNSVENAAARKPKIHRFITRFARIYTPVVVALAAGTAVIPSLLDGNWNYWVYTALSFLVMSCPCALVLSVPLTFFSGIGVGSRKGILFKGGLSMEALAGIRAVAMDKTGTLTDGKFCVRQVEGREDVLALCAALEQFSTHPIAASITLEAQQRGASCFPATQIEEIPGCGIRGVVDGKQIACGNDKLMKKLGITMPETKAHPVGALVWVAENNRMIGKILVSDGMKEDAPYAVAQLHSMEKTTAILTGDKESAARKIAEETGIKEVYAGLLPEEKLQILQTLREKYGPIMFVGDGINDAPVLAGADVGAAMGTGADAAMEAADVVFMTSQVYAVAEALKIARMTRKTAWQNVIFALAVKAGVMLLGLLGYASMWAAVFADSGVAMLCVLNAVGMLYRKENRSRTARKGKI